MSTFKQKLKTILNDALAFYVPRTSEEKFEYSILNTQRKIKNENSKHLFRNKSSFQMTHHKNNTNFLINKYQTKKIKQPNQINSLFISKPKVSECSLNKNKDNYFNTINQYSSYSNRINPKIQRDINSFKKENSLHNYKKMICNRPMSNLDNNILCNFDKNNYSTIPKKQYFNTKKNNSCIKISNNDFANLRGKNRKKDYIFDYKKKGNDILTGKEDKYHSFYLNKDINSCRVFSAKLYK